ncbi:MAG: N-acetylmuramoyl-L-alanine amidase [Actinomycetota bacterium]|nr:N-acetylmuramoyl-L-alanine amidase [Actinomycetota bacterium]
MTKSKVFRFLTIMPFILGMIAPGTFLHAQSEHPRFLVCLDPGHGGSDPGASYNGIDEKVPNLEIALRTRELLTSMGYGVIMTREDDTYVSLEERCRIANTAGATIFVSIHNNAYTTTSSGTETYAYYDSAEGKRLATFVHREVVKRLKRPDRGVKEAGFYVLKNTDMTATLLEGLFISNPEEAELLKKPETIEKIAEGVASGIDSYLKDPGAFDEYVLIQNPEEAQADIEVSFMQGDGNVQTLKESISPHARKSIHVDEYVSNSDVSTRIESKNGVGIVAERSMYFDLSGASGGHCALGVSSPSRIWYFAEGSTNWDFNTYILIQNPGNEANKVEAEFMDSNGDSRFYSFTLAPHSRFTLNVAELDGLEKADFSTRLVAQRDIIAERAMYWRKGLNTGGHVSPGMMEPGKSWYLAEGCARTGFDTFVCIGNPGKKEANVKLTYMLSDGKNVTQNLKLKAFSRGTVRLNDQKEILGSDVSIFVQATEPVLVERSIYFDAFGIKEGTNSTGICAPLNKWYFAEGYTDDGYDTYVLLLNPNSVTAEATLEFMLPDGSTRKIEVMISPRSRYSVRVDDVDGMKNVEFSTLVESELPLIAERAMYFRIGQRSGGHSSVGIPSPSQNWYFAEGCTR